MLKFVSYFLNPNGHKDQQWADLLVPEGQARHAAVVVEGKGKNQESSPAHCQAQTETAREVSNWSQGGEKH